MKLQTLLMEAKERKDGKRIAAMDVVICPRKLNLNLPLLSTRRLGSSSLEESSSSSHTSKSQVIMAASDRVPFSWEHAPGKPKIIISTQPNQTETDDNMDITPRPRLPPCRWQPDKPVSSSSAAATTTHIFCEGRNSGHKVDAVDDGLDHNKLEVSISSDVVDELSLTEAIDIAQKAESHDGIHDGLNLECSRDSNVDNHSSCPSPNFMIERFLPDATAIAAASSLLYNSLPQSSNKSVMFWNDDNIMKSCPWKKPTVEEGNLGCSDSTSPRKGCGLEIFHPWRMKHKLCGMNRPGKEVSSTVQSRKLMQFRKPKVNFPRD